VRRDAGEGGDAVTAAANGAGPPPAASPTGMLPSAPQYAQGFEGMATAAFTDEQRRVLAEMPAHEDVEIKPDGICFVPGVWYRRQLTKAFGAGAWALAPRGPVRTLGDVTTYHGALYVLGRWVAEAIGECDNQWMSPATRTESARTDCLTRCCKDLCMASELWDKTWREDWMRKNAESFDSRTKKDKDGRPKKEWRLRARRDARPADLGLSDEAQAPGPGVPEVSGQPSTKKSPAAEPDTGEAATAEAYEAIAAQFKRHKFTKGGAREWAAGLFGVETHTALSAAQADAAQVLLLAWQTPGYQALLDKLRAQGAVRP
jgi:Mitochondrial genome maintenance MGM101